MGPTEAVARFIAQSDLGDLPADVAEKAKIALIDGLGCALAGVPAESSVILLDYIRDIGGAPAASVTGTDLRTSLPEASLAIGHLASALLYDDTSHHMHGHSTATLLPVVLALGEALDRTGREMLEAYVVGFEIEGAVGLAADPEHYEHGWHPTSCVGSLGAAAAACRLMRLDADQTRMALALATTMTGGSRQNFGTMTQALHGGLPARNGVSAAMLAARGFTADPDILEARMGFFALYGPADRKVAFDPAVLGRDWSFRAPILAMKLYPCGFPTHRPIEGVLELAAENRIPPDDVAEMRAGVHYLIPETVFHHDPQTGLQGKTSIPYCMARALLDGRMGLAQFTDEKVRDPAARALMEKVTVEVPPDLSREAVRGKVNSIAAHAYVSITLKDGRELKKKVDYFRGDPMRPLSGEDVAEKFTDCAAAVLDPNAAQTVLKTMQELEKLESGAHLATLLTP